MIGDAILHYRILEEIGRGGMGVVYKANDTKLDRTVALKFLPSHVTPSEQDIHRFTQEAKAAAALNHPNVCTIYDIKESDKLHFIVMEFVEGITIRKKISERALSLDEVLTYALQIADALQEAHGRGIVHRDIKADNIMVNTKNQVKVMDFGLAKLKGTLKLTRSSSTVGTLAYMAPEQIQGGEVDARSDIFSFGVVLYEMLTAHMPFRGEHEAAMMYSILNEDPDPLQKYMPESPAELLHVMSRALEKNPEDRYQSIHDMAIDLRRMKKESSRITRPVLPLSAPEVRYASGAEPPLASVAGGQKSGAMPAPESPQKTTTVTLKIPSLGKKTLLRWVLPAVAIVVLFAGYFLLFSGAEEDTGTRIPVAVADFQNQTKEDDLDGLSGMLITSLEQSRKLSVLTRSRMFDVLKQMGKEDVSRIDESLGREICRRTNVGALVVASVSKFDQLYIIDMKVLDPEKNEYLLTIKEQAEGKANIPGMIDKLSERTRLGLKEKTADVEANRQGVAEMTTPSMEAYQAFFRGEESIQKLNFERAAVEFRRAVEIDSTFAMAHYRLAYALSWNNSPGSEEAIKKALRYIKGVPKKESYLIRAEEAMVNKDVALGLSILKEVWSLFPEDKEVNYLVGDYSFHQYDFSTAEGALRKVLVLDPTFSRAYQHLAWTLMFEGRLAEMRDVARQYVAKVPSADAFLHLAESYLKQELFDSALTVCMNATVEGDEQASLRSYQAFVYLSQRRFKRAESIFDSMATVVDAKGESARLGLEGLVTTAIWMGKYREALRHQDRLIEFATTQKKNGLLAAYLASRAFLTSALMGDAGAAKVFHDRAMKLKGYGSQDFYLSLRSYYRAIGDFEKADEIMRTVLVVVDPDGMLRDEAWREYYSGNYGSAIRMFRKLREPFHDDLYMLAKSFAATDQPDSALAVIGRLNHLYGVMFGLTWNRAFYDVKADYLTGTFYDKSGNRKRAIESYTRFLEDWKDADAGIPELIDGKKRLAALRSTAAN